MSKRLVMIGAILISGVVSQGALGATQSISGKVTLVQGHLSAACREVFVQDSSGTMYTFRIGLPSSGPDSIMTVVLSAEIAQLEVDVVYDPAITTGCGTEPEIQYVSVHSSN